MQVIEKFTGAVIRLPQLSAAVRGDLHGANRIGEGGDSIDCS